MSQTKSSKRTGLGRSFDTLLSQDFDDTILADPSERIQKLEINQIEPDKEQPRRHFEEEALANLAQSVKQHGILQPIIVTPHGDKYQIIAGERRWRAAALAKLKTVPAIVRTTKELERLEIALVENVQRVDLSPLEQAGSIERLHQQFNLTYEIIGSRLGKAVSTIHNIVRLLQLPEAARKALHDQQITEGHARQILALKDQTEKQEELLRLILERKWSVREAERFVTAFKSSTPNTKPKDLQAKVQTVTPETRKLSKQLGVTVNIRRTAKGGKLELNFKSDDELQQLIMVLLNTNND